MYYLKLVLCGPLQSYGTERSGWGFLKDTETHPTASAVAGIIACGLGIRKGTEEYERLLHLDYRTTTLDDPVILEDFQVVNPKEPNTTYKDSKYKTIKGTSKTQYTLSVYYIADGEFHVLVGSEDKEELKKIHAALWNPKWVYYLGRACCTPSKDLVPETFEVKTLEEYEKEEEYICI